MENDNELDTYEESKAENKLNEKQRVLTEIAKEYTNTLKKNFKISKIWFQRKFVIKIFKKSRELVEKRADCLYYPVKNKTKIGPLDDCDFFLPSFSQSILVVSQNDDFATVYEASSLYPRKGARIQLLSPSVICENDIYRVGKIVISIDKLTKSSLSVTLNSILSNSLKTKVTSSTKIGSTPDSDIKFSDNLTSNFQIMLIKDNYSWTIRNLNPNLIIWKYLTSENPSKKIPIIHSLYNNQYIHVGGNKILLEKI